MQKIMFDDLYNLTQAVVKGRKTVTRRIIPEDFFTLNWDRRGDTLVYENANGEFIDIRDSKYCKYKVGEEVNRLNITLNETIDQYKKIIKRMIVDL